MPQPLPDIALAERIATWGAALDGSGCCDDARHQAERMLLDVSGLCIAARHADYMRSLLAGWDGEGNCTALGHTRAFDPAGAALVNGTAAHGEDYDDTFEGTPVHAGAVAVPAVLATCERWGLPGERLLTGIVAAAELCCRMAVVTPTAIHRAGFHPTAVIGAIGAALGCGVALGLDPARLTRAMGIAGSMASGIIEYLAEGTSTKRLHAGWAAHSGYRAARFAQCGFTGPRTLFEGTHGFFHAFTNADATPDFSSLESIGEDLWMQRIAFKPFACGTMAQPFIDCAIRLREDGIDPGDIASITCDTGEGVVHRLWEPLAEKRTPTTAYSAKFSVPYCVAVALLDGAAGLVQFSDERVQDPRLLELAAKVNYRVDPDDEYPRNYTGHVQATLPDGTTRSARQPHLRGGVKAPLSDQELEAKFARNLAYGGWDEEATRHARAWVGCAFASPMVRADCLRASPAVRRSQPLCKEQP